MDVPGGQVQAHVQIVLGASCGELCQDIAAHAVVVVLAVAGLAGIVGGVGAVPDAEAVVVLRCDDQRAEAGLLQCLDQLLCIKVVLQLEDLVRGLGAVAFAPLDLVEGVGTEVAERRQTLLLVLILVCIRNHCVLFRCCHAVVRQGIYGYILIRSICLDRKADSDHGAHQCESQHQCDPSFRCAHSFSSFLFSTVDFLDPQYG